jgi:hypothetical protein
MYAQDVRKNIGWCNPFIYLPFCINNKHINQAITDVNTYSLVTVVYIKLVFELDD